MPHHLSIFRFPFSPPLERHYHSTLSIWLSVDPMSDKYPSTSPYAYCGNNPIVLKDPNGEEIWIIGEDGNRYKYNNGAIYTADNKPYSPEAGSFIENAKNAIDVLKTTRTGNRLISTFEGAEKKDVSIESSSKTICGNLIVEHGTNNFISETIYWNSMGTDVQTTAGTMKNAITDLGHEFSHVFDEAKKIKGLNDLCVKGGTRSEWRAVYNENLIRKDLNLPYRRGYNFNGYNGEPYFVNMLNHNNEPYMPNSLEWIPFENCEMMNQKK